MKQEASAFVYSTDLRVRQRLADPWPWSTDQPTVCNKTEVAPHTDCSVMISVHCTWNTSRVACALRQPSSVLMWHCQYLTVWAEFTTQSSQQCTWLVLVGAPSMHTMCHSHACSKHGNAVDSFLLWISWPSPPPTNVKLTDWENYGHLWTVAKWM